MKIIVLGGAGARGLHAVKQLIDGNVFDEIVIASRNIENTQKVVDSLNSDKVSAAQVDVMDRENLVELLKGADVVANATGPFYLLAEHVIEGAIEAGVNYVDLCDDVVVQKSIFTPELEKKAKEKGISVIIGLGASPGLLALHALAYGNEMDRVDTMDFYMAGTTAGGGLGGEAALLHIIENYIDGIEVIEDGEVKAEKAFEGVEMFDFGGDKGEIMVSTLGHPEIFSVPRVLPDIQNIRIKLGFYETEWLEGLKGMIESGFASTKPIEVDGVDVEPRKFLARQLTENSDPTVDFDYISTFVIIVSGETDGKQEEHRIRYRVFEEPATGFPLAIAAEWIAKDLITKKGMMVPEECIEPQAFVDEFIERMHKAGHHLKIEETNIYNGIITE